MDRQCVHRRRSVPFPCSLSCEGLDSWAYTHCQMLSSFLVAKSDSFFFGACSDGLPKLATWPGLSFASVHVWRLANVGSLTWLVFRQSVDPLITSSTRAPTICLPVSWVHIGRSTTLAKTIETTCAHVAQALISGACTRLCLACVTVSIFLARVVLTLAKKNIETATQAKLQARACSREHSPVPQRRAVVSIFLAKVV